MKGLEEMEVCCESFVPGVGAVEPRTQQMSMSDVNEVWVEQQFQLVLDRFVAAFAEAGTAVDDPSEVLVRG